MHILHIHLYIALCAHKQTCLETETEKSREAAACKHKQRGGSQGLGFFFITSFPSAQKGLGLRA